MALSDFTPERITVEYKGKPLMKVRGLNLDDVSLLVQTHLADLQRLYELVQDGSQNLFERLNADGFVIKLIGDMPVLAANLIAIAADEPENFAQARTLPLPLQVMVVRTIVSLTFEDFGGPKAFVALVRELAGKQLPAG